MPRVAGGLEGRRPSKILSIPARQGGNRGYSGRLGTLWVPPRTPPPRKSSFLRMDWLSWLGRMVWLSSSILSGGVALRDAEEDRQWLSEQALSYAHLHNTSLGVCLGRHCGRKCDRSRHASFDIGEIGGVGFQHPAEPARNYQRRLGDIGATAEGGCELDRLASGDSLSDTAECPGQVCGLALEMDRLLEAVEDPHLVAARDQRVDGVRADEPGAASDEDSHGIRSARAVAPAAV